MKDMDKKKGQALAMAATLATLGLSVGVNVQDLLAAGPEASIGANQIKIGHDGIKRDVRQNKEVIQQKLDAAQHKLPSVQDKGRMMPGRKPGEPVR